MKASSDLMENSGHHSTTLLWGPGLTLSYQACSHCAQRVNQQNGNFHGKMRKYKGYVAVKVLVTEEPQITAERLPSACSALRGHFHPPVPGPSLLNPVVSYFHNTHSGTLNNPLCLFRPTFPPWICSITYCLCSCWESPTLILTGPISRDGLTVRVLSQG